MATPTCGTARTLASAEAGIVGAVAEVRVDVERARCADDGVGAVVGGRRQGVGGAEHGVGHRQRRADHADAEHDRERGHHGAAAAGEQPAEREADHRVTSVRLATIEVSVGSAMSPAMRPSARNTTRSAVAAAFGSWVTMTIVWPNVSTASRSRLEDLGAGVRVEVAGRLVGEQHGRLADQRAGDRDPLLLAARELRRAVVATLGEADALDHRLDPVAVGLAAGELEAELDVLLRGQDREQVEGLEDEADRVAAQPGERAIVHVVMSRPSISTLPESGRSRPASTCMSVDLPEPEGPMTARYCSAGTAR